MKLLATAVVVGVLSVPVVSATRVAELNGRVLFATLPLPGATVTAKHGDKSLTTVSDGDGTFRFINLDDGLWMLRVEMRGFVAADLEVTLPMAEPRAVTLTIESYANIVAALGPPKPPAPASAANQAAASPPDEDAAHVMNGSVINGGASRFGQARAFGNNRPNLGRLYSMGISGNLANSAWNAKPYSFGGTSALPPSSGNGTLSLQLTGPLRIPFVVKYGPQFTLSYTHGLSHSENVRSALMPTEAQRAGDFSGAAFVLRDPVTGLPFEGNRIPAGRIVSQAAALLQYYPLPNTTTTTGANYQTFGASVNASDSVQFGINKRLNVRTAVNGNVGFQRSFAESINLFDFASPGTNSSISGSFGVTQRLGRTLELRLSYNVARASAGSTSFFSNRENVSGNAGITGNNQDPVNWGPPTLTFPDIADLTASNFQQATRLWHSSGAEFSWKRGSHNITFGGDVRWSAHDVASQPDPRGTLSFTGAATGSAFGDFLLGLPSTSSLAFGVPVARLRGTAFNAFVADDFRLLPGLTLNVGLRWEYEEPFGEKSGQLANLDVAPDFTASGPVVGTNPTGPVTHRVFRPTLVKRDFTGIEPRLALAWRPMLTSSLVFRVSHGLYRNLGTYQPIALMLAQQPPFSNSVSVQNSAATPITLANPFPVAPGGTTTFGIDPDYVAGYLRSTSFAVQYDLPASVTMIGAYFHDEGTHLMQAILPNTYPAGAANPCPTCPAGFVYVTSNGQSVRNASQLTIRRRLDSGLTAMWQYTLAKSNDNAATFSNTSVRPSSLALAQDWRNPDAEYGPSSFDQRHLHSISVQYTSGVGRRGGTLFEGIWAKWLKDWTITSQLNTGSGLPLTPMSFSAVTGTAFVGVRPALTGEPIGPGQAGAYANASAFETPAPGTWGNAGRNSIRGPSTFSLNMTIARAFRFPKRMTLEWRVAVSNLLNRVTFANINTTITSPQFGQPTAANPMRRIQTSFSFRF